VGETGETRSDGELVKAAQRGETGAFDALYFRHKEWAYRIAWRFTQDSVEAQDVVQEVFLYLARKIPTLKLTASLTTFLYPAVKHTALALKRKRRRMGSGWGAETPDVPAGEVGSDVSQVRQELGEALRGLSEAHREVLLMRFVDDMSLEEIAAALEIPLGTAKSRLHHAIGAVRENPRLMRHFGGEA
jgi:RNA polymerase sigma-70 factor (ECF subfamily)